jgi:hypothetical protein
MNSPNMCGRSDQASGGGKLAKVSRRGRPGYAIAGVKPTQVLYLKMSEVT